MEDSSVHPDKSTGGFSKRLEEVDEDCSSGEAVRILSVDKVTVEKIVLETERSREVLLTKSESSRKFGESKKRFLVKPKTVEEKISFGTKIGTGKVSAGKDASITRSRLKQGENGASSPSEKKQSTLKGGSRLPVSKVQKSGSVTSLNEKRISPIKLTKSSSIGSLIRTNKSLKAASPAKTRKVPPKVPQKPKRQIGASNYVGSSRTVGKEDSEALANRKDEGIKNEKDIRNEDKSREDHNDGGGSKSGTDQLEKIRIVDELKKDRSELVKVDATKLGPGSKSDPGGSSAAQDRLEKSQSEIERLQRNLGTSIHASTAETYKNEIVNLQAHSLKVVPIRDLDLNENVTRRSFDKEFLEKHNFDKKLKIEEKRLLETDLDYTSDTEKVDRQQAPAKYGKKVTEVEKRWSGEFLESQLDQNSSESSKSSYVEELGSISSHESIVEDAGTCRFVEQAQKRLDINLEDAIRKSNEVLEDTVSTVDSDSCLEDRIRAIDEDIEEAGDKGEFDETENESKNSTLKESSVKTCKTDDSSTLRDNDANCESKQRPVIEIDTLEASKRDFNGAESQSTTLTVRKVEDEKKIIVDTAFSKENNSKEVNNGSFIETAADPDAVEVPEDSIFSQAARRKREKNISKPSTGKDGYANLIQEFKMDAGTSKPAKDEKKRKGFRRLLPGLFSPKDSRKEYKKEQKEKKKREEKHFTQHQQNGNYTRSPDTMNLNEDIKRNVKLDTSLNSSIIEERLNEIKQELFPEQGIITSTPDHFLQGDRSLLQDGRSARTCTANSSLSSIAADDKWIDHNIISGSPDMRQIKQRRADDRKCSLERKHSLQDTQPRFMRNHGPSGRISAPPSERFLIRPRAVHPVDRPLPAIPQKVEFSNYENHNDLQKQRELSRGRRTTDNYPQESYVTDNQNYENGRLYENGNLMDADKVEINRNQSIDSGFNLTPVSAQVKITRQLIVNQNQKAPLIGRSAKYSPNTSQKSGDYADSSYTPNSSQKSEFSPSSSKSGEYYLNSPRGSSRTSPNDSFSERRDQTYENKQPSPRAYPISPNVKVETKTDRVYDETPVSPLPDRTRSPGFYEKSSSNSRIFNQTLPNADAIYVQRNSPNIPMSNNLAKLRATVDNVNEPDVANRIYSEKNVTGPSENSKQNPSRVLSPVRSLEGVASALPMSDVSRERAVSPVQNIPRVVSPSRMQRMTSPLTIVTQNQVRASSGPTSPHATRVPVAPQTRPMSPRQGRTPNEMRTPVSSPNMNQTRTSSSTGSYVSMSSRRSQPNDQILIASPKREAIYEIRRPGNRLEASCPESPVPMADSPSQVLGSRQSLKQTVAERLERCKSPLAHDPQKSSTLPTEPVYGGRQTLQKIVQNRALSPALNLPRSVQNSVPDRIQRPEPIYVQRQPNGMLAAVGAPIQDLRNHQRAASPAERQDAAVQQLKQQSHNQTEVQVIPATRNHEVKRQLVDPIYGERQVQAPGASPVNNSQQPIYSRRLEGVQPGTPRPPQVIYTSSQEQICRSRQSGHQEPIYTQQQDPIYAQRSSEPIYGQHRGRQLSPSKRQTMQHLEAFYLQHKALEAQRKLMTSPTRMSHQINQSPENKTEPPEVREAIYWQQLKRLDEEQQRRIYERNMMDEKADPLYWRRKLQSPPTSPTAGVIRHGSSPSLANQSMSLPPNVEQLYWRSKLQNSTVNPVGKPPIMGQKGQNQPVLVVRPQPQEQEQPVKKVSSQEFQEKDVPRSKSVSPHFTRSDERRSLSLPRQTSEPDDGGFQRNTREKSTVAALRKPDARPIYQEENETDRKPPPIFKRGSLISNSSSSVDYGAVGPKRVSFSNQTNSPEVGTGVWPTKHGMAPEPPTRKHKIDNPRSSTTSENDSVFLHDEENQNNTNNVYGNVLARSISQTAGPPGSLVNLVKNRIDPASENVTTSLDQEYDANRPLPPPPRETSWLLRRGGASTKDQGRSRPEKLDAGRRKDGNQQRKCPGLSESESGSEAGEVQRILHRRQDEEWNPDGKGRQSNDTGGSGRGEGEGGPNELPGGRRSGGVGGGILGVGGGGGSRGSGGTGSGGGRSRDEPRRHTLSGDHQPSLHHQQFNAQQLHSLHPHHLPQPHGQYGTPPSRYTTMDLEMGTKSRQRKSPLPRGYPPPSTAMLFDDDPGIMSEVETSSTGFRRGGKQRSSLPVVRTPSKTLERPLGLVFLQYRNETKRALLPNEVTSIDTVKALFVRSFPKQLTMEYLDSPHVKVYIHDSNKDMFYELEDLRSHLRDIRDRSVLRLFESADGVAGMPGPMGAPAGGTALPPHWEDQSYFSEPEFDSEFQHQHIHKSKTAKNSTSGSGGYYMGSSSTLPRGGPLLRAYSPAASSVATGPNAAPTQPKTLSTPGGGGVAPAKPLRSYQCGKSPLGSLGGSARFSRDSSVSLYSIPDRLHGESGYMSSPERGGGVGTGTGRYPAGPYSGGSSYEDPYYAQYSGTVTPVIDEEASDTELLEESYSLYGVKPPGRPPSGPPRSPFPPGAPALAPGGQPYDATRIRVEHMERQLANLTGLVQKALTHAPHTSPSPRDYLQVPAGRDPYRTAGAGDEFDKHSSSSSASLPDDSYLRTDVKPPKLGKDKSVSFEKSVSFSDEPPDMNSPKQHSPQHAADTKPTKPAIKSSTLPRMSSQERDSRHKPTPPPKPAALAADQYVYRDLALTPEMYNQLRGLQKKAKDLRQEVRNLRRMSQAQAHTVRETIRDTFITIRAMLLSGGDVVWASGDTEKIRLSREEDLYKQEMIRLEKDLTELESTVEELRGNVINHKTRVNTSDVENMALILSKSSKTVADLKVRFPSLQEGMKGLLSSEMEKVVREEKFLKEEPERLESALKRCKKLASTLVTLKRLASVQEQRLPNAVSVEAEETPPIIPTSAQHSKATAPVPAERTVLGSAGILGGGPHAGDPSAPHQQRPENALDALLDELQTFSRPASQLSQASSVSHSSNRPPNLSEIGRSASQVKQTNRAPNMSDIGRKGSIDSSTSLAIVTPGHTNTLRRLHSYPSSSDTDTSPPIARLQVSDGTTPPQKPPVPERNAELLQLATARRVPPPPPPRTSSRSPLASPTSPQLPPRNPTGTLRRGRSNIKETGKPPMALPPNANAGEEHIPPNNILSTSNSSSCESINSQEGLQNKKGRQEQLEQRHQELLRKQKALQEQYARLQQLQRNASGLTTVPPAPPDLLKKTGSESNLLAKMGLGLSTASSGSLTSLTTKANQDQQQNSQPMQNATGNQTTTSKIYETDIL
ncbi:uncharacterized protein LOC107263617 isoform X5 [Cephus cinctus]|uniref:Uncharacterized protein LOC107263617 isoform X5 n=1 Tax=Cephus cinctus TaxID=211228 RepID=A0AAJ7FDJ5_CEPCN|nr:uncharacterized protein LOC107263617 isoform X5 [Cephus cinctus]